MKINQPVSFFASAICVCAYVLFTVLAFSQFSGPYSPLNNWLSDLGNIDVNYALLGTAFIFSVFALRYHRTVPLWVLGVGIFTGMVDILSSIFQTTTWLEWVTVALFLGYVLMVGFETRRLNPKE